MNKDQKIEELRQKIDMLEAQKQSLQEELYKVEVAFQEFKSQYSSVMLDMSAQLSSLSESIRSLRSELAILTSAETEPEPVVTEQVKEEASASDFVLNEVPVDVEDVTAKEEFEQAASYEACVAGMESSTVVSDLNKSTDSSEPVQEATASEPVQEATASEPVQEATASEPVLESVSSESVQETVSSEPVQETAASEPVQETVNPEQTQERVKSEQTQESFRAESTQKTAEAETTRKTNTAQTSAKAEPKEETIFDKLRDNFDWEKFVGENLISKLGILIVLIGVAIGGKYAIEHQLLSPAMRMIMGVAFGAALQGVAIKLKKDYKKLSAVLASGSMATLYFMTFFSYHLYGLIPMPVAFVAMTLITVATVWLACSYDMEIIAIIGLVGAYVIPFALSTGEGGSPWILFSYISIINAGVMFISVKRYWRILFVSAFLSSWLILIAIYRFGNFKADPDSVKMLLFLFVNFTIFYVTFLAYKVKHSLIFQHFDIHFLLSNSFLFFGLGYNVIYNNAMLAPSVVWFTLFNAILHAVVAFMLVKKDMVDKSVSRLIAGLAISFLTIAILVWMTGHWLTMFWMLEGTVLFTVSRLYQRPFYEKMSYPILFLALVSLIIDWGNPNGGHLMILTPMFEAFAHYRTMWDVSTAAVQGSALSIINTLVFIALCIFLTVIDHRYPLVENEETQNSWMRKASLCLKVMAVFVVTTAILVHIERPWLTMCWMLEATILFTFARVRKNLFFEKSSYPVFALAFSSLMIDWGNPNVDHLKIMTPFFKAFTSADAVSHSSVLSIVDTLVFIALSVFAAVIDRRYPMVENEETKDSWMKIAASYLKGMAVFVVTTAILVHIGHPWLTMCWMLEGTLLFGFSRIRKMLFYERSSYPVLVLAIISLLVDWGNPNAEHLEFMTFWFEELCPAGYGYALYITNTIVCMVLSVCVAVLNYRYPLEETEETKNSFVTIASQFLAVMAIFVVTMAIYVHIEQPWMTVLWCAEVLLLCYLGRTKSIPMVERGAYCLVALSTVGFLHAWGELSSYEFFTRVDEAADSFSMSIGEMWESVVAGLSLIMTIVGVLWMINKFKPLHDDVAEKRGLKPKLEQFLVIVLAFVIWTHTPWIITTILYFALALGCLYWSLRFDAKQMKVFYGVFALAFICWFMDLCGGFKERCQIVMLIGTMVSVALVYFMRYFNEKTEFAESKVANIPFVAILELMPFVSLGIVLVDHASDWLMCYALAYFSTWTFVSLKMNWDGFKKFSMVCLCLMILVKMWLGLFELKIGDASAHFDLRHFVSLALVLFSVWTLYCYKKQEGRMFGMSESQTTKAFDTFLYFGSVVVVGKELNSICQFVGCPESFGVVFSVFLGIVSLFGVYYGLYKDKKYLRIEGFVLLGFTLLKLFFYDMAHFDQIYKVIALISLGLFMLVIAFFYQKIAKEKEQTKENELSKTGDAPKDEAQPNVEKQMIETEQSEKEDSKVEAE